MADRRPGGQVESGTRRRGSSRGRVSCQGLRGREDDGGRAVARTARIEDEAAAAALILLGAAAPVESDAVVASLALPLAIETFRLFLATICAELGTPDAPL
jgi:hypothetical protein